MRSLCPGRIESRGHTVRSLLIFGIFFLFSSSCARNDSVQTHFTVTDSAGITVVQNDGTIPPDGGGWVVAEEPSLSIGTVEGEEVYQLFGVAGIHRLSDGRIGVVNAGSHEVRFYSSDGAFLSAFGQRGGGPEEFEMPALAGSLGDTLIVVDRAHHRLTFLHPDDGFADLVRVSDEVGGFLNPAGSFANGQTVFGGAFDMRKIGELKNGMNRAGTFYRSSGRDGSMGTDFGDKPGAEFFIQDLEAGGQQARPQVIPFARIPAATVSPHFLFFSAQDGYEIEVFDPTGQLVRLIRLDVDPIPVTSNDGELHIQRVVERVGSPDQAAGIRAQLGSLPLPEFFPPHASLLADRLDCLWVQDFQRPSVENRTWNIFDPEGVFVGRVTLPENFNPVQIGTDYVLGLGWDDLNIEYVRMYTLTRGSRAH